jgi:hypothetical protein
MSRPHSLPASLLALTVAAAAAATGACSDPAVVRSATSGMALHFDGSRAVDAAGVSDPASRRQYGPAQKVGTGVVRTYVVVDAKSRVPLEVGVAMSEQALEGLPAPSPHAAHMAAKDGHEHLDSHVYDLTLPAKNPTPYKFVELDWNPGGHEPPGVYDHPHFDFHFYTVDKAVRTGIDPTLMSDAEYRAKSANLPQDVERWPFYAALAAPGAPIMAVPRMGTHWVDLRTPELQGLLGKPEAFRPFTTTFLHGSWDGRVIFDEPMITRAFITGRKAATEPAQRDSVIALPQAQRSSPAGYYPAAYRVTYDAQAKEYRIALTQLTRRN